MSDDEKVADVVHKAVQLDELAECIRENTAARGVDVWAVEEMGLTASQWAGMTDRDQSTVARNVRRANGDE
jgi:hypothetical protein